MCESGMGLLNLRQIFEACLTRTNVLRLEACILGADDLQASLGLKRQQGTDDTLFARRWVVLHARAFGLQPIDQVYIDYKNSHGLQAEALEGRGIGMAGKQIIHPSQIAPVQASWAGATGAVTQQLPG
jgi:citrate lyase beta subunit